MNNTKPTTILLNENKFQNEQQTHKIIIRLGWISFFFGSCIFLIHFLPFNLIKHNSPINAEILIGFFLMISGLVSVNAGIQRSSYRSLKHAQIWSITLVLIFLPSLIVISIVAFIFNNDQSNDVCQKTLSSRVLLFGNSFEVYPSNVDCIKMQKFINQTQIIYTIQLIISVSCFFLHLFLLSIQQKILQHIENSTINIHL